MQLRERTTPRAGLRRPLPPRVRWGGADGNERLTGTTAAVLLVLLALEGATILALRPLLPVHILVGMLLVPPVALKLATTGWRFARYYARSRPYLLKGPPPALLRFAVAPGVVVSTAALFGTGVALLVVGPAGGLVLGLHKASFVIWFLTMSAHVLWHLRRVPPLAAADWRGRHALPGARARAAAVSLALVAGAALAAATYPLAEPWLHWAALAR